MSNQSPTPMDQLLFDLFTTALEGGIGYWSKCSLYHNSLPDEQTTPSQDDYEGFKAVIHDYADDESAEFDEWPVHTIDRKIISKGYRLATTEWRNKVAWSTGKPPVVVGPDTDWDYDAGDADVIVQLGLFGEVVYG